MVSGKGNREVEGPRGEAVWGGLTTQGLEQGARIQKGPRHFRLWKPRLRT